MPKETLETLETFIDKAKKIHNNKYDYKNTFNYYHHLLVIYYLTKY